MFLVRMCWELETTFISQHISINLNFSGRSGVFPEHMHWKPETAYDSQQFFEQYQGTFQGGAVCFLCTCTESQRQPTTASTYFNNLNFSGRSGMFPILKCGFRTNLLMPQCKSLLATSIVCDVGIAESTIAQHQSLTPWTFQVGAICPLCTCAWSRKQTLLPNTYLINLNFSGRSCVFPKHMHCKPEAAYDSQHIF